MNKKNVINPAFTLLLILTFLSCKTEISPKVVEEVKQDPTNTDWIAYINNPNPDDSLCISEINRAKEDVKKGKIVFSHSAGFGFGNVRYRTELRQVCKQLGLTFDIESYSCIVIPGQTQGCYGQYMDKVLSEKYGPNTKARIYKWADYLYLHNILKNNEIIQYWICDEQPKFKNQKDRTENYVTSMYQSELPLTIKKNDFSTTPYFDLKITIERDGSVSKVEKDYFFAGSIENEPYEKELFILAEAFVLHNMPTYVPGKIRGHPVRTYDSIQLHILNSSVN